MLNNVVLIGKVIELPVCVKDESGAKKTTLILEIERPFKDSDGLYHTDCFRVQLWKGIADQIVEFCTIGSLIALKGRLEAFVSNCDMCDGREYEVIAEKVTFLSNRITN